MSWLAEVEQKVNLAGSTDIRFSKLATLLRPKRSWIRFSLRSMLVLTTTFGIWLGLHVRSARLQKLSLNAVQDYGGQVRYDYQYPTGHYGRDDVDNRATSPVPTWLLDSLGVDFFHDVVEVDVHRDYGNGRRNPNTDDGLLHRLHGFPELRRLELVHCGITDDGLRRLPVFASLETLDLSYSSVTDDAMPYLGRLKSLKWLDLAHTRVNGRGFHKLARLEHLEVLNLTLTPIRDEALSKIGVMEGLEHVSVFRCRHLTREGVANFRQKVPNCYLYGSYTLKKFWKTETP